ncbi:hypothetical protein GXP70_27105 [Paenibacillus lycopersici]|uniref:Glycoside hydrolase n=1 Tax=Paenibacillus lycopersici TaxID=2704462 RepID=A0A6C0G5Z5_9BACL|nr:glycosyl hydrolase family 28 protein [Paenibacillus lycopersici]QHT63269.1 hypothetical protein GXP70_27105 [Paenibacillus lycopersici]
MANNDTQDQGISAGIDPGLPLAKDWKPSADYRVFAGGREAAVHCSEGTSFAIIVCPEAEELALEVEAAAAFDRVVVRPLSAGIVPSADGGKLRFAVRAGHKLSIEPDGDTKRPLLLFVQPEEAAKPNANDPQVHYYGGGRVYDAGRIVLRANETVYIEEGTIVRGTIFAEEAVNIAVRGRGVLDGSGWRGVRASDDERRNMIKLIGCERVVLEGITVLDGDSWHVLPIACRDVTVVGLNIVTFEGTGDGIDIVGCEDVAISGCFIRSNDDCIAVKAVDYFHPSGCKDVRNVHVSDCVMWNAPWGNALEIGYETQCETIENIVFEHIDIIRCEFEGWQSGGTFTIHNGDRAIVRNVRYDNIRIEDSQEKLVDIKVLHSKYSRDAERGFVRDIRFSNIHIVDGPFPVSVIRGFDEAHLIEDVSFTNLTAYGQRLRSANEARMVVELAKGITFE